MGQEEKHIGQTIWEIAHRGDQPGLRFPVMSGVVAAGSVDMSACTCSVLLNVDDTDSPATGGILLNSVSGNVNGVLCFPADGSNVWVAEIDGPGKWGIIKTSDLVKMVVTVGSASLTMTDGLIQFNDGSLGGLTKTLELKDQINKLNTLVQHLVTIINGAPIPEPGSGANSALQLALKNAILSDSVGDFSNIENTNVKQA